MELADGYRVSAGMGIGYAEVRDSSCQAFFKWLWRLHTFQPRSTAAGHIGRMTALEALLCGRIVHPKSNALKRTPRATEHRPAYDNEFLPWGSGVAACMKS
jgi:hypothetical protein